MNDERQPRERINQKARTRQALVAAARELVRQGERPTVAKAAKLALVSDATAYRYFPDQAALLREALFVPWQGSAAVFANMAPGAGAADRVAIATRDLLNFILANETAVRTVMGLALMRSVEGAAGREEARHMRPGHRVALIDEALQPFEQTFSPPALDVLKRALTIVMSAESVVALKDHRGSSNDEVLAIASWMARVLVEAAMNKQPAHRPGTDAASDARE